jgi:hypothetical protein
VPLLSALPAVPGLSCPSSAAALGGAGLGTVCQLASGVTGAAGSAVSSVAGSAVSSVAGFGVNTVLNALGSWVSSGATWLLSQVGAVLASTTSVDLTATWFTSHYGAMAALAGVVVVPLLLLGVVQSIYRQNASALVRSVVVNVPLAVLLTAVAVKLVTLGLALTDAMSSAVASGSGLDAGHFMTGVTAALSGSALADPSVPAFIVFLGSLVVVFGAALIWIELLIRSAAVYVAVLFLPLALASLAWPAISHWCRRLVDTLAALILGKFVIVSVLSLAAGELNGVGDANGGGFSAVLGGAALLLLAACSPWTLLRLMPFIEAGAVGHLEGLSQRARHTASVPARALAQVAMDVAGVGSVAGAATAVISGAMGRSDGTGGSGSAGSGAGPGGGSGRGPGNSGGTVGGGPGTGPRTGGPGAPPGGGGSGADRATPSDDLEPSSAETIGVGTATSPAKGIPWYPAHEQASASAERMRSELGLDEPSVSAMSASPGPASASGGAPAVGDLPVGSGISLSSLSPPSSPEGPPTPDPTRGGADAVSPAPSPLVPLPRQSGTVYPDMLGRDRLGPRLIAARQPPAHRPDRVDPDA